MFINNIDPALFRIGAIEIRYYGLVYAIGFLVAYFLLRRLAKSGNIKNFDEERADTFTLYLIAGSIIGARVLDFVFYNPSIFITDPLEIFRTWHGGMSIHGGLIGAVISGFIFCKRNKVSFYKLADFLVLPLSLFLFFGRITNFINGELPGTKTDVPWCVVFRDYDGCRHPSQLYEAAKNLLIFFTLLTLQTKESLKKKLNDGALFWIFIIMYGVLRFVINFWRDDARFLGLSTGQYLCIAMVVIGSAFLYKIQTNKKQRNK